MFGALGKIAARRPWIVIGVWLIAAVGIVATAPALQSTQDQSEFLPRHYESVKALELQQEAFPERGEIGAIIVFDRADGGQLTDEDQAAVADIAEQLNGEEFKNLGTAAATPASENGLVQAIFMTVQQGKNAFDADAMDDAKQLREDLEAAGGRHRPAVRCHRAGCTVARLAGVLRDRPRHRRSGGPCC